MSLTIRVQRGSSSIPFPPHSSTRSVLICESRITYTADYRITARGVAQAKHVAILVLPTQIGIAWVGAMVFIPRSIRQTTTLCMPNHKVARCSDSIYERVEARAFVPAVCRNVEVAALVEEG